MTPANKLRRKPTRRAPHLGRLYRAIIKIIDRENGDVGSVREELAVLLRIDLRRAQARRIILER
jgi:hypothetical protein